MYPNSRVPVWPGRGGRFTVKRGRGRWGRSSMNVGEGLGRTGI